MTSCPVEHYKIVLIGDSSVGKTQLIQRLTKNSFSADQGNTRGIEVTAKSLLVNGSQAHVQIWDTCGQERYRCVSAPYFRGALGALAVFDLTQPQTLANVSHWLEELRSKASEAIRILLVGTKDDLVAERQVTLQEAQAFAAAESLEYIETSALTGHNVPEAFTLLIKKIVAKTVLGSSANSISLLSLPDKKKDSCKC